ncbi:MAG: acetate--CoA ligase family protein [Bacteroidales bacterium]|jgi:acetyltransferase|nr:acetate--CoA ligase family protein [Bacteroidales bacterium]
MIHPALLHPRSIVVIGGSNDVQKPGGAVLRNLIEGDFDGKLYVTNLKETEVQGIPCFKDPSELPDVDLAIIAIPAKFVPCTIEILAFVKNTRAFIVLSAGFSEESEAGRELENEMVDTVNSVHGSLIGPNCIGVLTPFYHGVFTKFIPKLDSRGCDFISGSGATAVFIMEAGIPKGLTFSQVFSVGNSAQLGVEEILEHLDENFDPVTSSRIKLLYIETITKPQLLLKHASSLIRKGCRIAAIKAGSSEAGSRAASSHTGALASPDVAVDALFRKAGIVRCYGREDLVSVASVFTFPELKGQNMAIITHAGGPAVMLTDVLSNGGMNVPHIDNPEAKELLTMLFPGSSVANPIDFLATGTAQQLGTIIDYSDQKFSEIDGMAVIFGTPGLTPVFDVYDVLDRKMKTTGKPVFPILPSIITAAAEVQEFVSRGHTFFPDEVIFGNALTRIYRTPKPSPEAYEFPEIDQKKIRNIIESSPDGYITPGSIQGLMDACGIPRVGESVVTSADEAITSARQLGFPVVMKVVGPVHKSDVGGVVLDVKDEATVTHEFKRMIRIRDTVAILIQPMLSGVELFVGAKFEPKFGHLILCGMGGIFIETLKDVSAGLSPLNCDEALQMIRSLKSYKIIQGVRGQKGVNEILFADVMVRLSALLNAAPEIIELDFNPLLGSETRVVAVDARICLKR